MSSQLEVNSETEADDACKLTKVEQVTSPSKCQLGEAEEDEDEDDDEVSPKTL